ncbi:MAG: T9SS type A sorting domain-containing protein [bacterium]|nr:T9SS type A sorting domain-containing protein [bacterium]
MKKKLFCVIGVLLSTYCFGFKAVSINNKLLSENCIGNNTNKSISLLSTNEAKGIEWIKYYNAQPAWVFNDTVEYAVYFNSADFPGVQFPLWIKKVKHTFYENTQAPWGADSTFKFKIYGDDGTTLLHESAVLNARKYPTVTEYDLGADSVQISNGKFWVSVKKVALSGLPSLLGDNNFTGHSFSGVPGAWDSLLWTDNGGGESELSTYAYVSYGSLDNDVAVVSYTNPSTGVRVSTPYPVTFTVENKGAASATFVTGCIITASGSPVYTDTQTVSGLAAGASQTVTLSNWTPALYGQTFIIGFTTYLTGDMVTVNDTLSGTSISYEEGEIAYDDFKKDAQFIVTDTAGQSDAFAVRFTPELTLPFSVTKAKIYTNCDTTSKLEYVGLFPGNNTAPDLLSPFDKINNPTVDTGINWTTVWFDTAKTKITTVDKLWLVAKFLPQGQGLYIGADSSQPVEGNSYWTQDLSTWNPFTIGSIGFDCMMRIIHTKIGSVEEGNTVANNFKISYSANPVKGNTLISYTVPSKMNVSIKLYDLSGRVMQTLEDKFLNKGTYKASVNAKSIGTGIYFCKVQAGDYRETKKLVLMK